VGGSSTPQNVCCVSRHPEAVGRDTWRWVDEGCAAAPFDVVTNNGMVGVFKGASRAAYEVGQGS
jgi:hypothetical protein